MGDRWKQTAACLCLLFCIAGVRVSGQERGLLVVNVRDEMGKALDAGVVITINGAFVIERETYPEGVAKVPVPLQPYTVTVSNPYYYSQSLDVSPPTYEETVNFTLVPFPEPTFLDSDPSTLVVPQIGYVAGRVLSPEGRPVAGARASVEYGGGATTKEDGVFLIPVTIHPTLPGPFKVWAFPPALSPSVRPIPDFTTAYELTTYPERVPVTVGAVTSGIDIWMQSKSLFRVTARVATESGFVPPLTTVFLETASGLNRYTAQYPVPENGVVVFGSVPVGTYAIWAKSGGRAEGSAGLRDRVPFVNYDGSPRLAAAMHFELRNGPRDDIVLTLRPGGRVTGRIDLFDPTSEAQPTVWPTQVKAMPAGVVNGTYDIEDPNGRVMSDGGFVLEGVSGEVCLKVVNLPIGFRVQSITYQGRAIMHVPIVFEPGTQMDGVLVTLAPGRQDPFADAECRRD